MVRIATLYSFSIENWTFWGGMCEEVNPGYWSGGLARDKNYLVTELLCYFAGSLVRLCIFYVFSMENGIGSLIHWFIDSLFYCFFIVSWIDWLTVRLNSWLIHPFWKHVGVIWEAFGIHFGSIWEPLGDFWDLEAEEASGRPLDTKSVTPLS